MERETSSNNDYKWPKEQLAPLLIYKGTKLCEVHPSQACLGFAYQGKTQGPRNLCTSSAKHFFRRVSWVNLARVVVKMARKWKGKEGLKLPETLFTS